MTAQNEEPVVPMNLSDETMVSRRKLLKALAATSGAVVASQILPGQWMKPVIESGVLPAHAQGSPTRTPTPFYATPVPCSQVDGLDIILALDRSGSMVDGGSTKLADAKTAAKGFVDNVNTTRDNFGIISFANNTTRDFTLGKDKNGAKTVIDSLVGGGGTDIIGAVTAATSLLASSLANRRGPVLILLTDGQPTTGDPIPAANQAKQQGMYIITIGLGADVNKDLLRAMASSPNDYHDAPESVELNAIYQGILADLCNPNARQKWNGEDPTNGIQTFDEVGIH